MAFIYNNQKDAFMVDSIVELGITESLPETKMSVSQSLTFNNLQVMGQIVEDSSYSRKFSIGLNGNVTTRLFSETGTVPLPTAAPVAITASNATATTTGFSASWQSAAGATGYYLDVSTTMSFGSYVAGYQGRDVGNVLSYSVSGLSNGTPYFYRVRSYSPLGGVSANSNLIPMGTRTSGKAVVFNMLGTTLGAYLWKNGVLYWTPGSVAPQQTQTFSDGGMVGNLIQVESGYEGPFSQPKEGLLSGGVFFMN